MEQPETVYCHQTSIEHRKRFAQFFTPLTLAEVMAKWITTHPAVHSVLEPAMGLGVFTRCILKTRNDIQIKSFEIDPLIYKEQQKLFVGNSIEAHLEDYMYNDWASRYDGIICNPPYFKFHDYDNKGVIQEVEKHIGCRLNGATNLYTLFLLKSVYQLAEGGRLAYLIPSEFLNSDYGKWIKEYLIRSKTLRHIILFDFEDNVFEDALTTSCIILCAKDQLNDSVGFTTLRDKDDLRKVESIIDGYPLVEGEYNYPSSELEVEDKWRKYYQGSNATPYRDMVPFSTFAKVVRGIATGANDFFVFNRQKQQMYDIPDKDLTYCISKSADIKTSIFKSAHLEELENSEKNILILNVQEPLHAATRKYIEKGVQEETHKKYLTSCRSPWYSIEKRKKAPIWVSVFHRGDIKFVRNETEAINLTTFHCIYMNSQSLFAEIHPDLFFAYLLTDTAQQLLNDNRREYGNGLKKFEPNDLNKSKVLNLLLLSDAEQQEIMKLYQNHFDIEAIDALLKEKYMIV